MGCDVYANSHAIACKAGDAKVIASFPDVCLSPPSPPAGPVPVPYPNTSFDKDMQKGSKTVMIKGKEVMLKDQSFYKTSPLGDEAATRSFGGSVVTHVITGKTYFQAWSMDVQFEGQNVDRNLDLTGSNCASGPPSDVSVNTSQVGLPAGALEKCPCCEGPLHDNQHDGTGKSLPTQSEEEYYEGQQEFYADRIGQAQRRFETDLKGREKEKKSVNFCNETVDDVDFDQVATVQKEMFDAALGEYKRLKAANKDCRNLHKPGDPCGTHFKTPRTKRKKTLADGTVVNETPGQLARRQTTKGVESDVRRDAKAKYPGAPTGGDIAHMTPVDAGGCPVSTKNMIPKNTMERPECKRIDDLQTCLQGVPR